MLTQKVNKKKDQVMIAIIIVIFLIVAGILLKNYVFTGSAEIAGSPDEADAGADISPSILKEAPRTFNTEILKNGIYQSLVDNNAKIKKIEELKVGNSNPFAMEKKK